MAPPGPAALVDQIQTAQERSHVDFDYSAVETFVVWFVVPGVVRRLFPLPDRHPGGTLPNDHTDPAGDPNPVRDGLLDPLPKRF